MDFDGSPIRPVQLPGFEAQGLNLEEDPNNTFEQNDVVEV